MYVSQPLAWVCGALPDENEITAAFTIRTERIERRREIWHQMLQINADNLFSIGILAGVMNPIAINSRLHNVPDKGIWNWDPGAHFGLYSPDTFWFEQGSAH